MSCLSEARHLRRHGITLPVMILGYTSPAFAADLARSNITQALFSRESAAELSAEAVAAGVTVNCHLKVDTGMGRIGFAVRSGFEEALAEMEACYALPGLRITGVFQHFAVADSTEAGDEAYTCLLYTSRYPASRTGSARLHGESRCQRSEWFYVWHKRSPPSAPQSLSLIHI